MLELTGKNIVLFDYVNISVEWFGAIATFSAVIVALGLAVYANLKEYLLDKKLEKLLFQILSFEMNSISHKVVILLKGIKIHKSYIDNGLVPRAFLMNFADEMQILNKYMEMNRIHENIDKYLRIPSKKFSKTIISQIKLYEHQSSRLEILCQKIKITMEQQSSEFIEIDKYIFESLEGILEKSFQGVMQGFDLLKMKNNIVKIDSEIMKDLNISFEK